MATSTLAARRETDRCFRWARLVALLAALTVVLSACDWPMSGFDPARTSFNQFESRVNVANVGSLREAWRAPMSDVSGPPVVADGLAYVGNAGFPFAVKAFDARGRAGCAGTPRTCEPRWSGTVDAGVQTLSVVNRTVYVGAFNNKLEAFDTDGVRRCSGTPPTCSPLWTASGIDASSIVVAGGFVYAADAHNDRTLYAFDAAGAHGCSGTPRVCAPLWSAPGGRPSVANGIVYATRFVNDVTDVRAFDAKGVRGCSGNPKVCTPLWTGREHCCEDIFVAVTAPTVAHGLVFVGIEAGDEESNEGELIAFDAKGVQGCSGTPKTCVPMWRAPTDGVYSPPAVAGDRLYVTDMFYFDDTILGGTTTEHRNTLRAFDIDACSTSRPPCKPLWTAPEVGIDAPAVANGVVYVRTKTFQFAAFDAAGNVDCSGLPRICRPLPSSINTSEASSPVIANGVVYIASNGIRAYELP
jgi:outer membrane protein assembly factor BamB